MSMSPVTLLLAFLIVLWSVFYYRRRELRKLASTIPIYQGYPIIGHVEYLFIKDTHDYVSLFSSLAKKCTEGILGVWVATKLIVVITDATYIPILANARAKKGVFYQMTFGSFADGLFVTDDPTKWKELRKPLTQQMSKKLIDTEYYDIFNKRSIYCMEYVKKNLCGKKVNITPHMKDLVFDVFSETHLGCITRELVEQKLPFAELGFRYVFDEREKHVIEHTAGGGRDRYYPDSLLRRMREKNFTRETAIREIADVVIAGVDTTPAVLSNGLAFLAVHPEIQEQLYREQVAVLGKDHYQTPTIEQLSAMDLLSRVIKETLRLSSPAIMFRDLEENLKLDDKFTIPQGTTCIVSVEKITADERFWERPNEFYPDHFLPEKEAERPAYALPFFGFGPRMCPGMMYARRFLMIALSYFLRNFTISTHMKLQDFKYEVVLLREIINAQLQFIPR